MDRVKVSVVHCNAGDILAEDVINKKGITLVARNTLMNSFIKEKLIEMGITSVWVYIDRVGNPPIKEQTSYKEVKNYKSTILSIKKVINNLSAGKQIDYGELIEISDTVYSMVDDSYNILKYLNEVRNTDEYTYTHCVNVSFYGMLIAKWLGIHDYKIKEVIQAGLLHDIGKTKISGKILNKKGKLTPEEFNEIKMHTIYGYNIIKDINNINGNVKKTILMHHERVDGSGYPFGLTGDAIDLYTKIISVADTFDAITSDRVYKRRKTPFEAFETFMTTGIGVYDTAIIKTLFDSLPQYYIGANVILDNGEMGEIVYIPPHDIVSPIVNIQSNYIDLSQDNSVKVLSMV